MMLALREGVAEAYNAQADANGLADVEEDEAAQVPRHCCRPGTQS